MNPTAAPDFPASLEWINTDRPISLSALAGRAVLLYFGTFACSNCARLAPELRRLEESHPEVVIIEVHAPEFESFATVENFLEAVRHAEIDHPVAIDHDQRFWRAFGVRSWPTFALIDPAGNLVGKTAGEGLSQRLDLKLDRLAEEFERRGMIEKGPLQFTTIPATARAGSLYHPAKVTADRSRMRLLISDTGHHRIIVCGGDGKILEAIGTGAPGNTDGTFSDASFYLPEGLAFDEEADVLYVADTGNHTIRRVSWPDRRVETIAGTGLEAPSPSDGGPGTDVALNAPRDIALMGGYLYIAMAGANQVWRMDLDTHDIEPHAGSGREGLADGPLRAATFAGPSGIVTDGEVLYVADSGASAIRRIKRGMVETLIGQSLEDFGDLDTIARMARIHHPMGMASHQGLVYIADTYNHKIKELNPHTGWVLTKIGSGIRGYRNGMSGDARLSEPGDLVNLGGLWYIADTGNNAVRVYDPDRHMVSTLMLWG